MKRFRLKAQPEEAPEPRKETRGRKSSYEPKFARMAEAHCKLGATDAELGELFRVSTVTIWHWSNKHPEFNAALRQGKHAWDARVERSLAQRAIGYAVDTEEVKVDKDGNIIRYNLRKYFAPDTTACIFWLKNRQPERWRDVYDHRKMDDDTKTADELRKEIVKEALELGINLPAEVLAKGVANLGNGKDKTKH